MSLSSSHINLEPIDNKRLANLCGQFDEHLHQIESQLGVEIVNRGNLFFIKGKDQSIRAADKVLHRLYKETANDAELTPAKVHLLLQTISAPVHKEKEDFSDIQIHTKVGAIKARSRNQYDYLQALNKYDINFAIGPAGTGKTYLAVAAAVGALERQAARRIILVRPAVEAGERLGFLPGDLSQKVDPYLRPLYDALYAMLGFEHVNKLVERNIIEVAPLAYMRGRTLNDAYIILDEGQNTTREQMKMFLTRIGFSSKAIVTGDTTQIDLPKGQMSGLCHALDVLANAKGIGFSHFDSSDVVRHPLVQSIVEAYQKYESNDDHD